MISPLLLDCLVRAPQQGCSPLVRNQEKKKKTLSQQDEKKDPKPRVIFTTSLQFVGLNSLVEKGKLIR